MTLIKVNGYKINPAAIAMFDRREAQKYSNGNTPSGVYVLFIGGAKQWIADPEALAVEEQYERYAEGGDNRELPF